jgi:hypothetical protein
MDRLSVMPKSQTCLHGPTERYANVFCSADRPLLTQIIFREPAIVHAGCYDFGQNSE